MQEVYDFLKKAGVYYLATTEGNQPRVRPFGTALIHNGKLYIQTSKAKPCSKQMAKNPKVELSAMADDHWIRIEATAVNDDSRDAKVEMLEAHPQLKAMYSPDDDNTQVLYLKDATAMICSFASEPKTIKF